MAPTREPGAITLAKNEEYRAQQPEWNDIVRFTRRRRIGSEDVDGCV